MIGSTDDHTSLATAEEDNFFGKFANSEPGVRTADSRMAGLNADWELGASGLAAVWAPQNTREDLFASMKRREVYATTGSRIVLRFFGGWNYAPESTNSPASRPSDIVMVCQWVVNLPVLGTHLGGAGRKTLTLRISTKYRSSRLVRWGRRDMCGSLRRAV